MATLFEAQIVRALQQYFEVNSIRAIAYRYRQLLWHGQFTDIAVDSPENKYYLGIECKSIQSKKLYYRSHFKPDQIENMNAFLHLSGRNGMLAVEYRHRGTKSEAFFIPWNTVINQIETGLIGISHDDVNNIDEAIRLERVKEGYVIPSL
jgi:Holliday junction resolvase